MFSRFFIDRPIFASVMSIIITLGGSIALFTLPIAQYPDITPPTVEVTAYYPGANAEVVAATVAAPIEQQVNGVENMLYMSSQCTNDGKYTLTVTFKAGADLNIAQVLVQNRVSLAQPILPDLVKRRGISVTKKSSSILMIVNLYSPDGTRNSIDLSNYATIQLRDELARLLGVGDITYLGQRDYSMRVWLDPQKMAVRNLSANDVTAAIQQQNIQVAAGQIGQPPVPKGQVFQYTMTTLGRLSDIGQFEELVVKTDASGRIVHLGDVANIELGALSYDQTATLDGQPSVALSIYQLPGSNALDVSRLVKSKMEELRSRFPTGLDYKIVYDTTPFINESINEVFKTLRDAVILVAIVVLLFLQNWRSAVIPLIAVPVAIIGTFAVMAAIGFSLNNLTLFGLVLAIGIVVDDAIVVVEAVEHHIEEGMSPHDATVRAMEQVSGPVVAIGLVLSAVFVPCAFISGITGQFFRQFALTIAVSTVISMFVSLTLSPALSALLLKPRREGHYEALPRLAFVLIVGFLAYTLAVSPEAAGVARWSAALAPNNAYVPLAFPWVIAALGGVIGWFLSPLLNVALGWSFRMFNIGFKVSTNLYTRTVALFLRLSAVVLLVYAGLLFLTWFGFTHTPTGFIPAQDKGYLLVNVQLPDASSVVRTEDVVQRIEKIARKTRGVKNTVAISGQSILLNANAPNFGALYLMLDDFQNRNRPSLTGDAIAATLQERLRREVPEAVVNIFGAPPVEGLGTAGGFKIIVQDRGDNGLPTLQEKADKVVAAGEADPRLQRVFTSFRADTPWLELVVNRTQAKDKGVSIDDLRTTLESTLGPYYINDFNRFGRTWQVNVQAQESFREGTDGISQLKVRNSQGGMVPLTDFATWRFVSGPVLVMRYNMYPSAAVYADAAPGTSSGQAIAHLQADAKKELPKTMRAEWTELALLQLQTGNTAMWVFLLAVVLVFLVLAAQYESWSLPLAVILVVPMCLLCAIAGVVMAKMDVNIFTQIGFIVLVGLACKNAILIVEFAKARREEGADRRQATLDAVRLRLRPIMMTSFAFILGVVPLVISEGAGAEMRRALGTAVFAGMLGVTLFGIFLTPVFFYVIQWFTDQWRRETPAVADDALALVPSHESLWIEDGEHLIDRPS
ncbi:MAG TPA: transporter [Planctomycetales bacterium]|nr:transporter [Planctomycetales bacterium]